MKYYIIIPAHNEGKTIGSVIISSLKFSKNVIVVDDGSKDNTLGVLNNLRKGRENFITVYDCEKNGGKAEAVRLGMLHMAEKEDLDLFVLPSYCNSLTRSLLLLIFF